MAQEIIGKVVTYLFKSKDNGYKIAKIRIKDTDDYETIVGYFPELSIDIYYSFEGEFIKHIKYGTQFKVTNFKKHLNKNKEGIINYLSSDLFTGIGPVTANKIFMKYGESCIEKILENKDLLDEFSFTKEKKERFYNQLKNNQILESTLITLQSYGLTSKMAMKLYEKYGEFTISHIEENPYYLINEVDNFGFKKADKLALNMDISSNDIRRIDAGIYYTLENYCLQTGNTYINLETLILNIKKNLTRNIELDEVVIKLRIDELINLNKITKISDFLFLPTYYEAERSIKNKINLILNSKKSKSFDKNVDIAINYVENKIKIHYNSLQKKAIIDALKSKFSIITGGPGTGKTTVINGLLRTYAYLNNLNLEEANKNIALVAPTGRAAKRMSEATLFNAKTIHRLLGYGYDGLFTYNSENPLNLDLLIVDEASMIDIFLAKQLFDALKENTKIVFVGDEDQLPSVLPGQVLKDLIDSNIINVIRLKEIHRQALDSNIIKLSYAVKNGQLSNDLFTYNDDLIFINVESSKITITIKSLINQMIKKGYNLNEDIQILAPMYKGVNGIDQINLDIESEYIKSENFISNGIKEFKTNDKVLQLVNNPEKNIMNGDIGIVYQIYKNDTEEFMLVKFEDNLVRYQKDELDELNLAYAISIHKSQGSEYPIVILPIVKSYSIMLRRKIIYTAITRAKKNLIILGDLYSLKYGINNYDEDRNTYLKKLLKDENKELENISPYDFL